MSKLAGHKTISKTAVTEIMTSCASHPIAGNLRIADLSGYAVFRDIIDIFTTGHWSNFAQKHHFMRRFEKQTEMGAYTESLNWIRSNTLVGSAILAERARFFKEKGLLKQKPLVNRSSCGITPMPIGARKHSIGREILGEDYQDDESNDVNWQCIGNAMHALQDSFSKGHVMRSEPGTETRAGSIVGVERYNEPNKINHSHHDKAWQENETFTLTGRQAVNATKDLIIMFLNTGLSSPHGKPNALVGWKGFVDKWLSVSPQLGRLH